MLGRATLAKIRQNLVWALAYNAIGIPIAGASLLPPCSVSQPLGSSIIQTLVPAGVLSGKNKAFYRQVFTRSLSLIDGQQKNHPEAEDRLAHGLDTCLPR